MKNAQMMMSPRKSISLILGIVFIVLGLLPILNSFKIISFVLPPIPEIILRILALIGGVFLLFDAVSEGQMAFGMTQYAMFASYIVGIGILLLGLIPILNSMSIIGFTLPALGETILNWLYLIVGALLLFGGTQGF